MVGNLEVVHLYQQVRMDRNIIQFLETVYLVNRFLALRNLKFIHPSQKLCLFLV